MDVAEGKQSIECGWGSELLALLGEEMGFSGRKRGLETEREASGVQEASSPSVDGRERLYSGKELEIVTQEPIPGLPGKVRSHSVLHPRADCWRLAHSCETLPRLLSVPDPELHAGRHIVPVAAFSCFGLRVSSSQVVLEAYIVLGRERREVGKKILR